MKDHHLKTKIKDMIPKLNLDIINKVSTESKSADLVKRKNMHQLASGRNNEKEFSYKLLKLTKSPDCPKNGNIIFFKSPKRRQTKDFPDTNSSFEKSKINESSSKQKFVFNENIIKNLKKVNKRDKRRKSMSIEKISEISEDPKRMSVPSNLETLHMSDLLSIGDNRVRKKIFKSPEMQIHMRESQYLSQIDESNPKFSRKRSTNCEFNTNSLPRSPSYFMSPRSPGYSNRQIDILFSLINNSTEINKTTKQNFRYKAYNLNFEVLETSLLIQNSDLTFKDKHYQNFVIKDYTSNLKEKISYLRLILENGMMRNFFYVFSNLKSNERKELNIILEVICALIYKISQTLLLQFAQNPEEIDIVDVGKKMYPPIQVISEMSAFNSNLQIFQELNDFFNNSYKTYSIIDSKTNRGVYKKAAFIGLLNGISNIRLLINNFIEKYKIFEKIIVTKNMEEEINDQKHDFRTPEEKKYLQAIAQNEERQKESLALNDKLKGFVKKSLDRLVRNGQEQKEYVEKFIDYEINQNDKLLQNIEKSLSIINRGSETLSLEVKAKSNIIAGSLQRKILKLKQCSSKFYQE